MPIALVFPNSYRVGMSSLAVHTLYRLWNARDDLVCERVFAELPSPSTGRTPAECPQSLESGAHLDYFPIVAFSIPYEMDYFNVVATLRAAGIPPRASERDERHPLLIAGGPAVSANPEPLAPLLDAVLIGEVEPVLAALTDALHGVADGRDAALVALSQIPGLYLPGLPGAAAAARQPVLRQWLLDLDSSPTYSALLTPNTEFASMGLIEITRGCGRGCRFCLASYVYRPPRRRSAGGILATAQELLGHCNRIGLVGAAVSDHPEIDALALELRRMGARLSVSSVRADSVSEPLLRALVESGTRTLTIAPEAGSERLRTTIRKRQSEEDVLRTVSLATRLGFQQLKLYFMLGLPGEEQEDVQGVVDLAVQCARLFRRSVTVNVTPFVPKAHTPFQRLAQAGVAQVRERLSFVEKGLRRRGIDVRAESLFLSEVQGVLARGDRRLADLLLDLHELSPLSWRRALAGAACSTEEYLRERLANEPLPWEFIQSGIHAAYHQRPEPESGKIEFFLPRTSGDCTAR